TPMTVDRFSVRLRPGCKLTRCWRPSRHGCQLLVFVYSPGAEYPTGTRNGWPLEFKTCIGLFASTDAWTLMARSAGAGKVRHIRRPGPMRTVTIKLTIEGLVGEPICRPSSDVARCAD